MTGCPNCGSDTERDEITCPACAKTSEKEVPIWVKAVARVVSWALVIVALKYLIADGGLVRDGDRLFAVVTGRSAESVVGTAFAILATTGLFAFLFQAMVGDRANVVGGYAKAVSWSAKALVSALSWLARSLWEMVEGKPKGKGTRRSGRSGGGGAR